MIKQHHTVIRKILSDHIDTEQPFVGAEVGVFAGETSRMLLKQFPQLRLYMVDVWEKLPVGRTRPRTRDRIGWAEREALAATKFASDRRTIMKMTSADAAREIADGELDFIDIDACHLYESVREDLWTWHLKTSKIMMGHDYYGRLEQRGKWGVGRAVDEFAAEIGRQVNHDRLVWWIVL